MPDKYLLGTSEELPEGESRGFTPEVAGVAYPIMAVRKKGRIFAYRNLCPHAFIPLEWVPNEFLTFDKSMIQCANHGALFLIDSGKCVSGPCNGQSLIAVTIAEENEKLYLEI